MIHPIAAESARMIYYYLGLLLLSYALNRPWLITGLVALFLLRSWLPDPVLMLRTWGYMRALAAQVEVNPANLPARRKLAELWLEWRRPRRALPLLAEALLLDREDPGVLYLLGLTHLCMKQPQKALRAFAQTVNVEPGFRFGEPFLGTAGAFIQLERFEAAEEALGRYLRINSSSVKAYSLLASVRAEQGNKEGARCAGREARVTFWTIPWFRRRGQILWWLRAVVGRIWW